MTAAVPLSRTMKEPGNALERRIRPYAMAQLQAREHQWGLRQLLTAANVATGTRSARGAPPRPPRNTHGSHTLPKEAAKATGTHLALPSGPK